MNEKLFVVVRRDLSHGAQAVQSCHAALLFAKEHSETAARWFEQSNYLALLSVKDEQALSYLIFNAQERGVKFSVFREPDLDNSITAVALEPGLLSKRICSKLPLTLGSIAQR